MQNLTLGGTTELTAEEAIQTHGGETAAQIVINGVNAAIALVTRIFFE